MEGGQVVDSIVVRFLPGADGAGRIAVVADIAGFAGRSEAWIDAGRIASFAKAIGIYPLPNEHVVLASGYGRSYADLDQELIALRVYRVGGLGQVGINCHLAGETATSPPTRPQSVPDVRLELLTTYERPRTFSHHLAAVAEGNLDEAVISQETLL